MQTILMEEQLSPASNSNSFHGNNDTVQFDPLFTLASSVKECYKTDAIWCQVDGLSSKGFTKREEGD